MLNAMLPSDFCRWLKSMLDGRKTGALTAEETARIRETLSNVFRHEIDPQMGDAEHQALLSKIHAGPRSI
jgi:hypothetical protein